MSLPSPRYQVYYQDWDDIKEAREEKRDFKKLDGHYFIKDHHTNKRIYPPDLYKPGTIEYNNWLRNRVKLLNEKAL